MLGLSFTAQLSLWAIYSHLLQVWEESEEEETSCSNKYQTGKTLTGQSELMAVVWLGWGVNSPES